MEKYKQAEKFPLDEEQKNKVIELAKYSRDLANLFELLAFSDNSKQRDKLASSIDSIMEKMDDIIMNYLDVDIEFELN